MNKNAVSLYTLAGGLALAAAAPLPGASAAVVVFNDTIQWLGGAPVGSTVTEDPSGPTTISSLGFHRFTVTSAGTVTIDILSFELSQFTGQGVDVNGDGESAFIDSVIYLFVDDGTPNGGAFLAPYNDDSLNLGTDGSVNGRDSRISRNLTAGNYLLVIGAYDYGFDDINAGVNTGGGFGPYRWTGSQMVVADHGDYRVTITGNVIPPPGAAALLGLGGLAMTRRRR